MKWLIALVVIWLLAEALIWSFNGFAEYNALGRPLIQRVWVWVRGLL